MYDRYPPRDRSPRGYRDRSPPRARENREFRDYPRRDAAPAASGAPPAPLTDLAGSDRAVIYNLPFGFTWQELKSFLRQSTRVLGVDVLTDTSALVRFSDSNECLRAAATLHNTPFRGVLMYFGVPSEGHLSMPAAQPRRAHEGPSYKVYIFGLPYSFDWKDMKHLLSPYGDHYVDIKKDDQGRSRGFAVARFNNLEDAQACVDALNNTEIERRVLNVRLDKDVAV